MTRFVVIVCATCAVYRRSRRSTRPPRPSVHYLVLPSLQACRAILWVRLDDDYRRPSRPQGLLTVSLAPSSPCWLGGRATRSSSTFCLGPEWPWPRLVRVRSAQCCRRSLVLCTPSRTTCSGVDLASPLWPHPHSTRLFVDALVRSTFFVGL